MASAAHRAWVNAGKPNNGWIRPLRMIYTRLRGYGYTVYGIGNSAHLLANVPEDHCPFSVTGWPTAHPKWYLTAGDIMPPPSGSGLPSLQQLGAQMLADRKSGHAGMMWLKYMNWEPERNNGGPCYQERFMPTYAQRISSDRGHIHQSARSDMVNYAGSDTYDPVARIRNQGGGLDTMDEGYAPMTNPDWRTTPIRTLDMWLGEMEVTEEDGSYGGWGVPSPRTKRLREMTESLKGVSLGVQALLARPANPPAIVTLTPEDRAAIVADLAAALAPAVADEVHRRMQA